MRLLVSTPVAVVVDAGDVTSLRAEDATGAFGILPGHADFVTVLAISVITWRDAGGRERHVAVRGGVLSVSGGTLVEVATREAVGEDTLARLGREVLRRFEAEAVEDAASRLSATRLHLATIRQMQRYLQSGRAPVPGPGEPSRRGARTGDEPADAGGRG